MGQQLGGQPILILKEGTERSRGRDAQSNNIMAAKAVAEAVRTTLGPKGMDKMLVDNLGDVVVTNDGVTILKEMDIAHPAAKMMVEVAKTQDDEVGDGTTTAVVLAGELLKKTTDLMEKDVHPTVLASGFKMASEKTFEFLEKIAIPIDVKDEKMLVKLAKTAMTGKSSEALGESLSELSVKAARAVVDKDNKVNVQDDIGIIKVEGGVVSDSRLIDGVIIDKERVHALMPKRVDNAKIALLNTALEIEKTEVDAKIEITSPDQLQEFLDQEEKLLQDMVEKIKKAGTTAIFCQKGIDDLIQHYLSKSGIFAVRRVKESDMKKLAKATGSKVVNTVNELKSSDLGSAGIVEERKIGDEEMTFVEQCSNPKSVTIMLRGGTEHVVDELERGLNDALRVVQVALEDGRYVAGGGATEVELSLRMREFAATVGGREQLAIEVFADALEVIPRTLAENGGLDPIDTIIDLRAQHMDKKPTYGLNVFTGKSMDMAKEGVIEPLRVKSQAISGAADAAVMILRIDDVIASSGPPAGAPPGPEGDMGGMEGMY